MKSYSKLSAGAVMVLGLIAVPTVMAHADEGVVTKDFSIKDKDGEVVKEFKTNESIYLRGEYEEYFNISVSGQTYEIEKENVLKTVKHEVESLSVNQESVTIKTAPDVFGNAILSLKKGEVVYRLLETKEQAGFVKVKTAQSVEGWVTISSLKANVKNIPVSTKAFIADDSAKDQSLLYGDAVTVIGFEKNQYKLSVKDKTLVVDKSAISFSKPPERVIQPVVEGLPVSDSKVNKEEGDISHNDSLADRVIAKAYQYMGVPYVWGGTTPNGFDCSGFTQYVLRSQGVSIPRVASDQARGGKTIDRNNLQKGDMIFFETYKEGPSHVGFYIGEGNFIHAGGNQVKVSNLSNSYYNQRYLWAKRMF